jgi:pimeloyl-ACP methyl ester carboxylesterase
MLENLGPGTVRRRDFVRGAAALAGSAGFAGTATGRTSGGREDVRIASFDGVEIAGTLYTPDGAGPFPSVLVTHGYGSSSESGEVVREAERYRDAGYVVLTYDSRGMNDSDGQSTLDGPKEVGDALTLVEWLGNQSTVTTERDGSPRVGMDGISYAGGIQQNTAAARPELVDELCLDLSFDLGDGGPLDAIVPRMCWNDLEYDFAPNGVLKRSWVVGLYLSGIPATRTSQNGNVSFDGQDPKFLEWIVEGIATNEFPEEADPYLARRSPMAHRPEDVQVPVMLMQGWPDTIMPPIEAVRRFHSLQSNDTATRLVLYPGGHDEDELFLGLDNAIRAKLDDLSQAWMDSHVHPDRSPSLPDPVTMHTERPARNDGSAWRTADAFPPTETSPETLHLATAAETDSTPLVNPVAPGSTRGPTGTVYGSPGMDAPVQSAGFDFVATEPLEVVGTPSVDLAVEPLGAAETGPEAHLFAKFEHVVDGESSVVDEQVMPFSFSGSGVQRVTGPLPPLPQYRDTDERLRLTLSTTENGFVSSRESVGTVVQHASDESTLTLPTVGTGDGFAGGTGRL